METTFDFSKFKMLMAGFVLCGLSLGGIFFFAHMPVYSLIWLVTLLCGGAPLIYDVAKALLKGNFGVDLIAIVAICASVWAGQYLAGVVILLMLSGGEALEAYAQARAKRELTQLLSKAPRIAHIKKENNTLVDVSVDDVNVGDIVLIKPGEIVPVDGVVVSGESNINEAVITGESLPVEKRIGSLVYSGSVNEDRALEIKTIKNSKESKYQIIVKLVKEAEESQAPVVRLADKYAVFFNGITFGIAIITWFIFHDPTRVLAVLVVASPCPLLLATPIAMISGISKAARYGIVVKNGSALERLGQVKGLIFDKTGTLTLGTPEVYDTVTVSEISKDEILRIAVSVDQLSAHIFARALVAHGQHKSLSLSYPEKFEEFFGKGVVGEVENKKYFFGTLKFIGDNGVSIQKEIEREHDEFQQTGKTAVYLSDGTSLLGYVVFADIVRPDTRTMFESLARHNMSKIVMLTGDKKSVAENIARSVGITEYYAELLPEQKVEWIKTNQKKFGPMAMVGDGVNDAPALAASSVGIAMASHGASVASETGDVVIMVNNIHRVHDALHIAQRALNLAKQGIFIGMGISIALMVIALFGYIHPVFGAMLQEILDIGVILNALRLNFEKIEDFEN